MRSPAQPFLRGMLPIRRSQLTGEVLAGITLAALAIPQALGYAKIAGMPVVTGLYTLLLPMAVFACLGSSRHLVVAADSSTAAVLAAALARMAAPASASYVHLAALAALLTGALLLVARLARLGFLANFLSRTVLLGFLAGVGIVVAVAQLPDMLGVTVTGTRTLVVLWHTLAALPRAHPATVAVAGAVMAVVLVSGMITNRFPGALIGIVGAIIVSRLAHLSRHGVAIVGPFPRGLPVPIVPTFTLHDFTTLLGPAVSIFVIIVAQSAATARIYAAKFDETDDVDTDLVGLGAANVAAAFSGAFVVNGSPTQTQMVVTAGGRSQFAQLTTSAVVVFVLLLATGPLASLPTAALAAVVFLIALRLIDVPELRRIRSVRRDEFAVALLATVAVVALGVLDGIIVAMAASIIDHLRHSYHPTDSVLVKSGRGHWQPTPVRPGARTEDGLVVYRFGTSLYYANASRLVQDIRMLAAGEPLRWLVFDSAAISDVDYTAAVVLRQVIAEVTARHVRFVLSSVLASVRQQLDRYGISALLDPDAYYETSGAALEAFEAAWNGKPGDDPFPEKSG
ncbi:MAG TPA: SulP family inorganic anion transporter [Streptosporangiaceae bacterium]|nr:SulP family inorganic anion transporter [Streptosporangiaceae bacterium]